MRYKCKFFFLLLPSHKFITMKNKLKSLYFPFKSINNGAMKPLYFQMFIHTFTPFTTH